MCKFDRGEQPSSKFISGGTEHLVKVWDFDSGCRRDDEGPFGRGEIRQITTGDGRFAISVIKRHHREVWDLESKTCVVTLEA